MTARPPLVRSPWLRALCALALAVLPFAAGCRSAPPPATARVDTEVVAARRKIVFAAVAAWRVGVTQLRDALALDATRAAAAAFAAELVQLAARAELDLTATSEPFTVLERLKNERERVVAKVLDAGLFDELATPEQELWKGPAGLLLAEARPWLDRRADLFARKYFHDPDDQGGNLVEGILNSSFDLFRSVQIGDQGWQQSAGVSPWEAVARLEPFARVDDLGQLGLLAGLGTTYHFFPADADDDGLLPAWIQRVGVRLGAGYLRQEGDHGDLVLGGALQVRSLSVWCLWQPEENDVFVAVGAADFRWLGELTTWF